MLGLRFACKALLRMEWAVLCAIELLRMQWGAIAALELPCMQCVATHAEGQRACNECMQWAAMHIVAEGHAVAVLHAAGRLVCNQAAVYAVSCGVCICSLSMHWAALHALTCDPDAA